jgi:ribosomal protein L20
MNRKALAYLAVEDAAAFSAVVAQAKTALGAVS